MKASEHHITEHFHSGMPCLSLQGPECSVVSSLYRASTKIPVFTCAFNLHLCCHQPPTVLINMMLLILDSLQSLLHLSQSSNVATEDDVCAAEDGTQFGYSLVP